MERGENMKTDIGKRIAQVRRERGFSQEQLAEMAMINRVTLARYETGAIEPGAFAISRIADALDVSTDELLCRGRPARTWCPQGRLPLYKGQAMPQG